MRSVPGKVALFLLGLGLVCAVPPLVAKKKDKNNNNNKDQATDPSQAHQCRAVHALNRLTFGPRPGDVQQVLALGVDQWIDLQLHPDKIKDGAIESRLAAFRTLRMSSKEIVEEFPDQQMIRAVMEGKKPMPSDPARRAVFQVQIARLQERKERKAGGPNEAKAAPAAPAGSNTAIANTASMTPENSSAASDNASGAAADASTVGAVNDTGSASAPGNNEPMSSAAVPADEMKLGAVEGRTARRREDRLYADLSIQQLVDLPADQRYKKILGMSTEEQLALADSLRGGRGLEFLAGMDAKQKETLLAMNNPQGVVIEELTQAKLLRAIYSERQLEEVMTDFWFNHFNVYANKGADRLLLTTYEQDVIRPRALGKFEDLLVATAKSPAMLFYLDNWLSVGPNSARALGAPARSWGRRYPPRFPRPNAKRKQNSGLNENYGRELLELHTLSVNGGYSQRDVTEVAKVFTGWTIEKPFEGGGFRFEPRMHEPGPKFVQGHRIKPKGEDEGREVLHRLATSPQTAHFISLKLAQRFVMDDPPAALVERMAKTFLKKKGDIREVLATLFHSAEFWDDQTHRAKVKTPLEFVASALRATGAEVEDALPLTRQLNTMGMPLYGAQPPTGYSMKAETWVSSSALLNRMNFAVALTSGKVRGVRVDTGSLAGNGSQPGDVAMALSALEASLLAGEVSQQTHDSIAAQIPGPRSVPQKEDSGRHGDALRAPDVNVIAGLLLGSPEFQRR